MKIIELEITNIRGIKSVMLKPQGRNLVVWGPNGSGKSAVVDAIDFLLTGKISRLAGEGTGGITLKEHGPHVDHRPQDASVSATVTIPGYKDSIRIRRSIGAPAKLEYAKAAESALRPILAAAAKGQHVLSRRQILRFVAAEAGKRATDVQALLDLVAVEKIRKTLTQVETTARNNRTSSESSLRTAEQAIRNTLGCPAFDMKLVLQAINQIRNTLKAMPIDSIRADELKAGLSHPASSPQTPGVNPTLLRQDYDKLKDLLESARADETDDQLRESLAKLREDKRVLDQLRKLRLYELGICLVDEEGSCPLCGTKWPQGELKSHLQGHLAQAQLTSDALAQIAILVQRISARAKQTNDILLRLATAFSAHSLIDETVAVKKWSAQLGILINDLAEPTEKYPGEWSAEDVEGLCSDKETIDRISGAVTRLEGQLPKATSEQTAWDMLTRLEENLRQYEVSMASCSTAICTQELAQVLTSEFEKSRDAVLLTLYEEIRDRFVTLYRLIHTDDEGGFESSIRPDGAGLVLEVDFYGRGKFPPVAMHSEGHQDTMGICLYLALAEKLTKGVIDLTILDDVVMSVDGGHRRRICQMLNDAFPGRQFLITTHDKTWARELRSTGVVERSNSIEFSNWSVETGPVFSVETDLWNKIDELASKGDVPAAAQCLRRGAEQFFEFVSDTLQAQVCYKSDNRYDLGDFAPAAVGALKRHLKKAKESTRSWNNSEDEEALAELETVANQVIARSQIEQWAINENVHYNHWGEFQAGDFTPVAEAWRDLFGLFLCAKCEVPLFLVFDSKRQPASLRCKCGKVDWNLTRKAKS